MTVPRLGFPDTGGGAQEDLQTAGRFTDLTHNLATR